MKFTKLTSFALSCALLIGFTSTEFLRPSQTWANSSSTSEVIVAENTLKTGTFVTTEQDHPTTGQATIINENGQYYLEFDSQFDTATGPDVNVILYRGNTVPVNPSDKDYEVIAPLKSFQGAQRYPLPANLDLKEFESVAIWCRKFNVTFGYAAL